MKPAAICKSITFAGGLPVRSTAGPKSCCPASTIFCKAGLTISSQNGNRSRSDSGSTT